MEITTGTVISSKRLWWIKVNTKPIRLHSTDGARFPHSITVSYTVNSVSYSVRKYVPWSKACPQVGQQISVLYQPAKPQKATVIL